MSVASLEPSTTGMIKRTLECVARGNVHRALAAIGPDFEIADSVRVDADRYQGPAGLERWLHEWIDSWDDWGFATEHILEVDGRVVVLCRQWGRGRYCGVELDWRFAMAWTVVGDRIVRMEYFARWEDVEDGPTPPWRSSSVVT
jgi:hypothetical protein